MTPTRNTQVGMKVELVEKRLCLRRASCTLTDLTRFFDAFGIGATLQRVASRWNALK